MKVKIEDIETSIETERVTGRKLHVTETTYAVYDDDGNFLYRFHQSAMYPLVGNWSTGRHANSGMADALKIEWLLPPGESPLTWIK